jgi:hypothetical protein
MAEAKLTSLQENKFSTYTDIDTVFERNNNIVSRIPQLADSVTNFRSVISDISIKAVKRNTVTKGVTETKSLNRVGLENVVVEISSALFAYGHKASNEIIKAISNVTPSSLDRMRDTEVINKANVILNTAAENEEALLNFGVDAEDITKLRNSIAGYKTSSTDKSGSHTESKVITKTLKEMFQNAADILDNELDRMMDSLQTKEKNFYDSYYAVRSVKNLGIRHRKQHESKPAEK